MHVRENYARAMHVRENYMFVQVISKLTALLSILKNLDLLDY